MIIEPIQYLFAEANMSRAALDGRWRLRFRSMNKR